MRKEAKTHNTVSMARVQGYHEDSTWTDPQAYAFRGFECNKFFTSDRYIKLDENFRKLTDGTDVCKGYGLEIETECNGISMQAVLAEVLDKIIFDKFPAGLFKMQRDSSLGGETSAECITQVMTKAFIRNNYRNFKTMFEYFRAFGISADSSTTSCGMHVNISRSLFGQSEETQAEAVKKLCYIINKHYDFCAALFYRDRRRTMWCGKIDRWADRENAKSINLQNQPNDHGLCLNLSHYEAGRVEIRLVGGQKDFPCFRNTMEAVFFLVDRVKKLSWEDCDSLAKIFRGCNQYVYDRIATYCAQRGTVDAGTVQTIAQTVKREELI